jgi:KaiC/GvpD/RAD55 family RecA-like ATPase
MMERRLVKTGIPGLDEILGGGILEGSIITVGGRSGSGRSTFALQFLYNGAMLYGEPGLYISIEESKQDFFFHMSGYNWDLESAEKEQQLLFLDYPIYEVDQILTQYGAIQEIIQSTGIKRVVIDSVMPIALFFPNEDERKKGFMKLIDNVRKWGTTTLMVAEDRTSTSIGILPSSAYGIESFTDGWINIYFHYNPKAQERKRAVEVIKMKGICHSNKAYPAEMDEEGFRILYEGKKPAAPPEELPGRAAPKAVKKAAPKPKKAPTVKRKVLGVRKLIKKSK